MKKIALHSHLKGNIGHVFMSMGFEEILANLYADHCSITHFEQHNHFCIYPSYNPLRILDYVRHGKLSSLRHYLARDDVYKKLWSLSKDLSHFNCVIACGGPSLTRGIGSVPEMKLMYLHQFGAFQYYSVPSLDLGLGSGGFPLHYQDIEIPDTYFSKLDIEYFDTLFSYTTRTVVRDVFAQRLCNYLHRDAQILPCAAFLSGIQFEKLDSSILSSSKRKTIVINYQESGANDAWDQIIDKDKYRSTIMHFAMSIKKDYNVLFLCHNSKEVRDFHTLDLKFDYVWPKSKSEYCDHLKEAYAGVASRIHAAIPMASVGVPVLGIGTDTRLGTLTEFGLKTCFVNDITLDYLISFVQSINPAYERDRLLTRRNILIDSYSKLISETIS